jgi:hypothetical protein
MSLSPSSPARRAGPAPLVALLPRSAAAFSAGAAAAPGLPAAHRVPARAPVRAAQDAVRHGSAPAARPNRIGQFGMFSLWALERIAAHVEPIKGLHVWTAQALYVALAGAASQQGTASTGEGQRCRVTVAELAARTRMGKRNVQRYQAVLEDAGVVRILHRHDALHRPLANDYLFVYSGPEQQGMVTPESGGPDSRVAPPGAAVPDSQPNRDSGVTTKSQKEIQENQDLEERNCATGRERGDGRNANGSPVTTNRNGPGTSASKDTCGSSPAAQRWRRVRGVLEGEISAAVLQAWIAPLVPVEPVEPPESDTEPSAAAREAPLVLACGSAFQRDQVERRYRQTIERAAGGPVVLVLGGPTGAALEGSATDVR